VTGFEIMAAWFYIMLGFVVIASAAVAFQGIIDGIRNRLCRMRKKYGYKPKRYTGRKGI